MKKKRLGYLSLIMLVAVFAVCAASCGTRAEDLSFNTEYQAVFVDNGQVFFGKLERGGSGHPLLRDVYYIGRQASPDGKEVKNILLKRGAEWHAPDFMYLTASHIAMIEPVSPISRVAELIKDLKTQQTVQTPTK